MYDDEFSFFKSHFREYSGTMYSRMGSIEWFGARRSSLAIITASEWRRHFHNTRNSSKIEDVGYVDLIIITIEGLYWRRRYQKLLIKACWQWISSSLRDVRLGKTFGACFFLGFASARPIFEKATTSYCSEGERAEIDLAILFRRVYVETFYRARHIEQLDFICSLIDSKSMKRLRYRKMCESEKAAGKRNGWCNLHVRYMCSVHKVLFDLRECTRAAGWCCCCRVANI